jgi:hypothetical protein
MALHLTSLTIAPEYPMRSLYVLLLSRAFSTKGRASLEAIPVSLRRFTTRPLNEVTSSSSATNPYIVPTYLHCIAVPAGYADNSYNVPCRSSLDAEYSIGWRPIEKHERGERELTVHRLHSPPRAISGI